MRLKPTKGDLAECSFETLGGGGGTMGENHSFWLLKRFLIFQGISGDLDANLLKHISLKIQ